MILTATRGEQLGQPVVLTMAYAATVRSLIAVIATLDREVKILQGPVTNHFGRHPDAAGHAHNDAVRRLANRLVGILHGCLKTRTRYDEDTAWSHRMRQAA